MAKNSRQRKREQAATPRSRDMGTPETRAKLAQDPLLWLFERRNEFEAEHLMAAQEIGEIYEAIAKPLGVRQMATEPRVDGSAHMAPLLLPERLERPWRAVYIPWTEKLHEHGIGDLVMHCVIERVSLIDLDKMYRRRKGTSARVVTEALGWYVERAQRGGWIRRVAA